MVLKEENITIYQLLYARSGQLLGCTERQHVPALMDVDYERTQGCASMPSAADGLGCLSLESSFYANIGAVGRPSQRKWKCRMIKRGRWCTHSCTCTHSNAREHTHCAEAAMHHVGSVGAPPVQRG